MLCLTFTNRAARGSCIIDRLNYQGEMRLFVGNVHRFCSHFLFDNNIVSKSSTVIEEKDCLEIVDYIIHHELYDEVNIGNYDSEESYEENLLKEDPKLLTNELPNCDLKTVRNLQISIKKLNDSTKKGKIKDNGIDRSLINEWKAYLTEANS